MKPPVKSDEFGKFHFCFNMRGIEYYAYKKRIGNHIEISLIPVSFFKQLQRENRMMGAVLGGICIMVIYAMIYFLHSLFF